jgi:hypothetical protein
MAIPNEHAEGEERFGIEHLFGSRTRSRLLHLFLQQPDERFFVRELTRKIDAQLNSVRRELSHLLAIGIIQEMESEEGAEKKVADRRKYYVTNKKCILFEELRALFAKAAVMMQQDVLRGLLQDTGIQVLMLAGVFCAGSEAETDVLIVGTPDTRVLGERVKRIEEQIGQELNYTVMPAEEYLYRKDIGDRFLASVVNGEHVALHDALAPLLDGKRL